MSWKVPFPPWRKCFCLFFVRRWRREVDIALAHTREAQGSSRKCCAIDAVGPAVGTLLGTTWCHFGTFFHARNYLITGMKAFGPFWRNFVPIWALLEAVGHRLGAIGPLLGATGPLLDTIGPILGPWAFIWVLC